MYVLHPDMFLTTVVTAPSPAGSGTSLAVASGDGARFSAPCAAWVYPAGAMPNDDVAQSEELRITAVSADTLTVVRATNPSLGSRTILVGDFVYLRVPEKLLVPAPGASPAKVALVAGVNTGGALFAWQNPLSVPIVVERVVLNVTTPATGTCNVDVGTTATSAVTLSDNLLDGDDVHTAAVLADTNNSTFRGSNGKSVQVLAGSKWVTGSAEAGGGSDTTGLAGVAYIYWRPA